MKRWKKWTLVVLGFLVVSQLPFVYRRFQLRQLRAAIQELNSQRAASEPTDLYTDYRGVIHVHSLLGGHSTGSFSEIIEAANQNALGFVVMTEHPSAAIDTSAMTLKGFHHGVLFIGGNELSAATGERLLVLPGSASANTANTKSIRDLAAEEKRAGRLSFVAYPQDFRSWDVTDYDGVEVYNLYTNARRINPLIMFFDGLWSYGSYPDLLFTRFYERPTESLKLWDEQSAAQGRRLVAVAGNDAHANVGLHLGDAGGKKYLQILLDPYERSFRIVRTHALIEKDKPLSADALVEALGSGHCYIAFDLLCDATGFRFTAENGSEKKIMGDEVALNMGVRLSVTAPVKSRIVLFKNGHVQAEAANSLSAEFAVTERGIYRVEVYLDQLGSAFRDRPWIISNPIYVK